MPSEFSCASQPLLAGAGRVAGMKSRILSTQQQDVQSVRGECDELGSCCAASSYSAMSKRHQLPRVSCIAVYASNTAASGKHMHSDEHVI
jgi:hypothetical protein